MVTNNRMPSFRHDLMLWRESTIACAQEVISVCSEGEVGPDMTMHRPPRGDATTLWPIRTRAWGVMNAGQAPADGEKGAANRGFPRRFLNSS
jgi:hypothetical protein